ncbi:MAG: aryl-sulfate sulfotransferase [Acidobacteriaceae bacterium]
MRFSIASLCTVFLLVAVAGCGGGGSSTNKASTAGSTAVTSGSADFSLAIVPATVTLTAGGAPQSATITASPVNGFTGNVSVTVGSLPSGVTATPATFSIAPGALQQISIAATSAAAAGSATISLQATSGTLSHSITTALTVGPAGASTTATASLSGSSFDFGNNLVNNTVTQSVVTVTNTGSVGLTLNPSLSGDPSYALVSTGSCGAQVAAAASCPVMVSYTPKTASAPSTQSAVLNLGFGGVSSGTPQTVALSGTSSMLAAGQVTSTDNPQVALYTMTLPFPGNMTVNFGPTTDYGTKTWSQSTTASAGQISIFVAGMKGSSTYHMQASVQFTNGISALDVDHTFTTKPVPANMQPKITATATPGMTPQPGVELLNMLDGTPSGIAITDLAGNVLWTYATPGVITNYIQGVKLLPNGDFLMAIGPNSSDPLTGIPTGTIDEIREVNLAGDTVREISIDDLNILLATATCAECNVNLLSFHHDVTPLPNGHWLVLGNTTRILSTTSQPSLNSGPPTTVLGDVVVDLDENLRPVWAWNAFNHLNPNHHPYMFPDWTHANAILYSPDDGNFMISMRHENFVYKIAYNNGTGNGAVIWHLGEGGDFILKNGVDPTDWQYAQHDPAYFSSNTTGVFALGVMDNGDDRIFSSNVTCNTTNNPPCLYTTIPVFSIDETAMTATLVFHQILPGPLYSFFGGSVGQLANSNIEYDLCGLANTTSQVFEVTPQSTPQTVWNMTVSGTYLYRAFRIPSLYPGVQW